MNILTVSNLTKAYDHSHGIFKLDLSVDSGDIVLLLGPNGAGKTTAFNCMLDLTSSSSDEVSLLGDKINNSNKSSIGAMISKPSFYETMNAEKYLSLFAKFYNLSEHRIIEVLTQVGLLEEKDKKISAYSTGMKQRLDFARAILHEPRLLILDEPFSGMDIEGKVEIKNILKSLKSTGIIISSHMVGDLERLANKVVIISKGKTLFMGPMTEVTSSGLTLEEFYLQKSNSLKEVI